MRRFITAIMVFGLLAFTARAQTSPPISATTSNAPAAPPSIDHGLQEIIDAAETSPLALTIMAEYAKNASRNPFGIRADLLHSVGDSQNVYAGLGFEFINGQAEFVSGNATFKTSLNPKLSFDPDLRFNPWAYVGAGTPFGTHKTVTVAGETAGGIQCSLWHSKDGNWSAGINLGIEKRTDITGPIFLGGGDVTYHWGKGVNPVNGG